MGSVEWVTLQGPVSHWMVGGGMEGDVVVVVVDEEDVGSRVEGRRRAGGIV